MSNKLWGLSSFLFSGHKGQSDWDVRLTHSPLSSAQVKNEWSHISTLTLCLCGMHTDSLMICTFLLMVNSHENFKFLSQKSYLKLQTSALWLNLRACWGVSMSHVHFS